jgi:hypothetical protein
MLLRACSTLTLLLTMLTTHAQESPQKSAVALIDLIELLGELDDEEVEGLEASMLEAESKRDSVNQQQANHLTIENSKKGAK